MTPTTEFLKSCADRIASDAVDDVADAAAFEATLADLVVQVAERMPAGEPLDTQRLRSAGADDVVMARVLRAIEAECIEVLRERDDDSFRDDVLQLRNYVRTAIPHAPLSAEDAEFYRQLVEAPAGDAAGDLARLIRLFQTLTATVPDLIYVHDTSGSLLYINQSGLAMAGYTRDDLLEGMSIYDLIVPKYLDLIEERMAQVSPTLKPFNIEIYSKDGGRIPIEIATRPLIESRNLAGIVGVGRNLRLERRLESALTKSNLYLENLIGSLPIGILTTDRGGVIQDANEAAVRQLGAESLRDLLGLPVHELLQEEKPEIRTQLETALREGRDGHVQCTEQTRFGATLHCQATLTPVRDAAGEAVGLLLLMADASEQIALQERLLQTQRMSVLGQVMAGVAHELNNPLTGVLGYTQVMLAQEQDETKHRQLQRIHEETERCKLLIQTFLNFARQEPETWASININQIIQEALALLQYQLRIHEVTLETDLDPEIPNLEMDASGIQRALLNVLTNALYALAQRDGGERRLTVRSARLAQTLQVTVEDTGVGTTKDVQEQVFDPFFTTKPLGEGVGLGLTLAYGIVANHHGSVTFDSEPDKGTTIVITLPVKSHHA